MSLHTYQESPTAASKPTLIAVWHTGCTWDCPQCRPSDEGDDQ